MRGLRVPVQIDPDAYVLFDVASIWAARTGHMLRIVSGNDHTHARNSYHYQGRALDFWASDMDGLATWLERHGFSTIWRAPGHWAHVHADDSGQDYGGL